MRPFTKQKILILIMYDYFSINIIIIYIYIVFISKISDLKNYIILKIIFHKIHSVKDKIIKMEIKNYFIILS
jgi:hypothetical protein